MIRTVEWHPLAIDDLLQMPWRAAAEVDLSLQRFAERGEGTIRALTIDGQRQYRLYVAPYFVWFSVTPSTIIAWRVLRYSDA